MEPATDGSVIDDRRSQASAQRGPHAYQRSLTTTLRLRRLIRRLLQCVIAPLIVIAGFACTPIAGELTPEALAKLQPELCKPGSSFFQTVTAVLPFLVGSPTSSMAPEQIALIDQDKETDRRKLWVLRLPAAFIAERTCDAGRQNWVGDGDDIRVDQIYRLNLMLMPDRIVPLTRASKEEQEAGIAVEIRLYNQLRSPAFRRSAYAKYGSVIDRVGVDGPPRCADQPSDIPGLVTFKRIDPNVRHPMDCESGPSEGAFAEKMGDLLYDFIALCSVNCRVHRHYHGWDAQYAYSRKRLAEWQTIHARLREFFDRHTVHRDVDEA